METSIKSIFGTFEPFFAFILTMSIFKGNLMTILTSHEVEEMIRIFMAILFSIYYVLKIIRLFQIKDEIESIKIRLDELEKLGKSKIN
jgi:hypothetical protein